MECASLLKQFSRFINLNLIILIYYFYLLFYSKQFNGSNDKNKFFMQRPMRKVGVYVHPISFAVSSVKIKTNFITFIYVLQLIYFYALICFSNLSVFIYQFSLEKGRGRGRDRKSQYLVHIKYI